MQMSQHQAEKFHKQKAKQQAKTQRMAKAKALCAASGECDQALALEILKAQERAAEREAKRAENEAKIRGTKKD